MIEALFVGGPMTGRREALPRAFPTHSFRMYEPCAKSSTLVVFGGAKAISKTCVELTYVLDTKNFEPWVYVLKGISDAERDREHADALRMLRGKASLLPPW